MAKKNVVYQKNGWIVTELVSKKEAVLPEDRTEVSAGYTVRYDPPTKASHDPYEGQAMSVADAFLQLPPTIRCLPTADRFLKEMQEKGLIEKPKASEQTTDEHPEQKRKVRKYSPKKKG